MTGRPGIGVVTFPGTLDDRDAARAVRLAGARARLAVARATPTCTGVDAVVLPGGFSYGDYLRAGAISRFAPVMGAVVDAAHGGLPVLGICNGFQVLTEAHLLPGSMIKNDHLHFVCREQVLSSRTPTPPGPATSAPGEQHHDPAEEPGRPVRRRRAHARRARGRGPRRVPLRGRNPNGSRRDIAGITNARGNVVGLMPHPEHAVEAGFGPDGAKARAPVPTGCASSRPC